MGRVAEAGALQGFPRPFLIEIAGDDVLQGP